MYSMKSYFDFRHGIDIHMYIKFNHLENLFYIIIYNQDNTFL